MTKEFFLRAGYAEKTVEINKCVMSEKLGQAELGNTTASHFPPPTPQSKLTLNRAHNLGFSYIYIVYICILVSCVSFIT